VVYITLVTRRIEVHNNTKKHLSNLSSVALHSYFKLMLLILKWKVTYWLRKPQWSVGIRRLLKLLKMYTSH